MITLQNPILPIQANPIEIDRAIVDLQVKLTNALSWITQGYGRAYKHVSLTDGSRVYFPEVYLGKQLEDFRYSNISPDNDKTGQNFFLVKEERVNDFRQGQYNYLSYEVAIIFSANLALINETLLETDYFQQDLVRQVRQVLTREAVGVPYVIECRTTEYLFDDVFRDFNISQQEQLESSGMTHFRVNCLITLREECGDLPLDRCEAIKNNITTDELINCLQPIYDYSLDSFFNGLSAQQEFDIGVRICPSAPPALTSTLLDGITEYVDTNYNAAHELERTDSFSMGVWAKFPIGETGGAIVAKFNQDDNARKGYYWQTLFNGTVRFVFTGNNLLGNKIEVRTIDTVLDNDWHYHSISYDGSSLGSGFKMYIDGVLSVSNIVTDNLTQSTVDPSKKVKIGFLDLIAPNYFGGNLFQVDVWKGKVLTDAEMVLKANPININTQIYVTFLTISNDMGKGHLYGTDTVVYPDNTGLTTGYQGVLIDPSDIVSDIPM